MTCARNPLGLSGHTWGKTVPATPGECIPTAFTQSGIRLIMAEQNFAPPTIIFLRSSNMIHTLYGPKSKLYGENSLNVIWFKEYRLLLTYGLRQGCMFVGFSFYKSLLSNCAILHSNVFMQNFKIWYKISFFIVKLWKQMPTFGTSSGYASILICCKIANFLVKHKALDLK